MAFHTSGLNPWRYVEVLPTHPSYHNPVHPDADYEAVTAAMVEQAIQDAYEQGVSDEKFGPRLGAVMRKEKRRINQHRARRRLNAKRRA